MPAPFEMTNVHVTDLRSIRNIKIAWLIRAMRLPPWKPLGRGCRQRALRHSAAANGAFERHRSRFHAGHGADQR